MTTEKQLKAEAELQMPALTAEERKHTEHMKLNADDPRKGAEAERNARRGIKQPEAGGLHKK